MSAASAPSSSQHPPPLPEVSGCVSAASAPPPLSSSPASEGSSSSSHEGEVGWLDIIEDKKLDEAVKEDAVVWLTAREPDRGIGLFNDDNSTDKFWAEFTTSIDGDLLVFEHIPGGRPVIFRDVRSYVVNVVEQKVYKWFQAGAFSHKVVTTMPNFNRLWWRYVEGNSPDHELLEVHHDTHRGLVLV